MLTTKGLGRKLQWGFTRRCARCGRGKAFDTYFRMKERCEVCGYPFERESGYWVGALIVNIAVCEIWFFLLFVGTIIATMPNIAWEALLVVGLITNGLLPILFYPFSKSLWMAIDTHFHPPRPD